MNKKVYIFLLLILMLAGCQRRENAVSTGDVGVMLDKNYGSVCVDMTIDEFNALGFSYGDSVDISFSNGKSFNDVPYYSGYYCPVDALLVCGYPGDPTVVIAREYGSSTWEEFELNDSSKVKITMNEKGKYLTTQEVFSLKYSDERADYDSDVIFGNFRELKGGKLKENLIYRSASPCDDQHKRASCVDALCKEYDIRSVINLADDEAEYEEYRKAPDFDSDHYDLLYQNGDVLLLDLGVNYRSDEFAQKISDALFTMTKNDPPCLIHCLEGKDRTGFVGALILALSDASADEIVDDYMITYYNYYGITKEDSPERYNAVKENVNDFLYYLCDVERGTSYDKMDVKEGAEAYLKRGGLTDDEISQIEAYLCK